MRSWHRKSGDVPTAYLRHVTIVEPMMGSSAKGVPGQRNTGQRNTGVSQGVTTHTPEEDSFNVCPSLNRFTPLI